MLRGCAIYCLLHLTIVTSTCCMAQVLPGQMTIPWSSSVYVSFGKGLTNPGPPISTSNTSLTYTTDSCPGPDTYTIVNAITCPKFSKVKGAGHLYFQPFQFEPDTGYMMVATYTAGSTPRIIYSQTAANLCSNQPYLFWASIQNIGPLTCFYPNFTFSVETTAGAVIASFPTNDIGFNDKPIWYPGYYDPVMGPSPPFYGGIFQLPPGITDVVVKLIANKSTATATCVASVAIDNILLTPLGPGINIATTTSGYKTSSCYIGNIPVVLDASFGNSYRQFGGPDYVPYSYANPAVQWQQSLDYGYTWIDIPGETSMHLSHVFSNPDTFMIRLRGSEAADIGNPNCSQTSNIAIVEVNSLPTNTSLASNSPVCTNDDLIFQLAGGVNYLTTGPNSFSDGSPFPHIFHAALVDTGWYYAKVFTPGGCFVLDSTHVIIRGPDLKAGGDSTICYGQSAPLHVSGANNYIWTPATGLSNPGSPDPIAAPVATTVYIVKGVDASGCSNTDTVTITLRDSVLKAAFTAPDAACPKDIVAFRDTSQGVITTWDWDFGNGETSTRQQPPTLVYAYTLSPQVYSIRLIITDTAGCSDTAVHQLLSAPNCTIDVPTSFSPNGDGNNDYLYPLNAYKATHLHFKVFDRMGQQVFETTDWTKKWDGALHEHPQPAGIYVWYLEYIDAKGERQTLKGTTLLVR